MTIVACPKCGAKNRFDEGKAARQNPICGRCGERLPGASASNGNKPITVTDASFQKDVLGSDRTLLLDCWAPWCGPCRMLTPTLDALAAESNGRYVIAKLNVDENPKTSGQFNISSIPAMLIFRDGKLVDRLIGLQPKAAIAAKLAQYAGTTQSP